MCNLPGFACPAPLHLLTPAPCTDKPELDAHSLVSGTDKKDHDKNGVSELGSDGAVFISSEPQELLGVDDGPWMLHPRVQPPPQSPATTGTFDRNNSGIYPVEFGGSGGDWSINAFNSEHPGPRTANLVSSTPAMNTAPNPELTTVNDPSLHPENTDRAQRLVELQQEQERITAEANRVRQLMELEAQQRRIEDEIRGLRGQRSNP